MVIVIGLYSIEHVKIVAVKKLNNSSRLHFNVIGPMQACHQRLHAEGGLHFLVYEQLLQYMPYNTPPGRKCLTLTQKQFGRQNCMSSM